MIIYSYFEKLKIDNPDLQIKFPDEKKKNIEVLNQPTRNDASQQIEEQLIVELYSK